MQNDNEALWQQYHKERKELLSRLDFKEVWGWVTDTTTDENTQHLPSYETLRNAHQFLSDMMCSHYIHIPDMYFVDGCVDLQWDMEDDKRLTIVFYPDNTWSVNLEKRVTSGDGIEPSFWMDEKDGSKTPHFFLKDQFQKEIEKPQQWSEVYEPRTHMRIMWATNYWDGPLSGYCTQSVGNDTFYFDIVEELPFSPSTRMYAAYKLSNWEQFWAHVNHAKWSAIVHVPVLWMMYLWKWGWTRQNDVETIQKQRDKWKQKHKLIGYFTY